MQVNSFQVAQALYNESKFWLTFGGALWTAFKAIQWVRSIKENDLHHIQEGVSDLKEGLDKQTDAIVDQLKDLREDFRTFYAQPMRARIASKRPAKAQRRKK